MKFASITTFSPQGYKLYGKRFLETYVKHWDVPIWVYYEGENPPEFEHQLITYVPLDEDEERKKFIETHQERCNEATNYRFKIVNFSHKVFALTDPKRLAAVETENWIWLDADIETISPVDDKFLESVCPDGFVGSYLGRCDWNHSECGFVCYNRNYGGFEFLATLRDIYTSGKILEFAEHHDSFIFDQVRTGWWYNISAEIPGMHVFDDSVLGTKMKHHKGPLRKKNGGLENLPPEYMSKKELKEVIKNNADTPVMINHGDSSQQQLVVKTKNCVPDKNIAANIHYFSSLVEKYVVECEPHNGTIVFCSGGPSLKGHLDEIKKLSRKKDHYVVCVKHAHDELIDYGIVPFACVLLDPRGHVVDFVENPHKKVTYLVASMVHPTTIDRLIEAEAKVFGYHAHVGAGEVDIVRDRLGEKHILLGGGCSTAMRGISVLHTIGFKNFKLFGYDLCYGQDEDIDMNKKAKDGQDYYMEVEVHGKKFITDAEKVAQAQDFAKIMKEKAISLEVYGDGMVPHIWRNRKMKPDFREVFT